MEFSMKDFWNGNRRALARAITIVEDERDGFEDIMKDIKKEAETRLKYRYLLEAIIKEEKIEIKDKDVDKEIAKIAKNYNVTEEEIMKEFGSKEVLKYNMAMEKAVEVLKENN